MSETQKTINKWARGIFGRAVPCVLAARANQEMAELITAISKDQRAKASVEMADIVICLFRLADSICVDLQEQIDRKMEINRKRKWVVDDYGVGQHVK